MRKRGERRRRESAGGARAEKSAQEERVRET